MDWSCLKLIIEQIVLYEKKYWKSSILILFFGTILRLIELVLRGIFIESQSWVYNYSLIIIIGTLLSVSFWQCFGSVTRCTSELRYWSKIIIYKGIPYMFLFSFFWDLKVIFYQFLGYVLPSLFLGILKFSDIFFLIIFSIIIGLFSYAFGFLFSPLFIRFRSESYDLIFILEDILSFIVPSSFLLSYFFFYKYLFFLPPIVFIEEFRKIILGIPNDYNIISLSFLFSIFYFLLGFFLFKKYLKIARLKGWVKLK